MGYHYTMTTNLHAHVTISSRDCDGPMYDEYITALNDAEIAEHESANGVNDFHDLNFKARVLSNHVSFHSEYGVTVKADADGFTSYEPTDEGHRTAEVRWCEDATCDSDYVSHRDVYAEMMGY